jgi:hypothetical protein
MSEIIDISGPDRHFKSDIVMKKGDPTMEHKVITKKNHDLHECSGNQSYFSMIDEQLRKLTIEKLLELSPGLWMLYHFAKADKIRDARKQTDAWFDYYKPQLRTLIGWDRKHFDPILSSSEAWNLAHRLIHDEVFKLKGRKKT